MNPWKGVEVGYSGDGWTGCMYWMARWTLVPVMPERCGGNARNVNPAKIVHDFARMPLRPARQTGEANHRTSGRLVVLDDWNDRYAFAADWFEALDHHLAPAVPYVHGYKDQPDRSTAGYVVWLDINREPVGVLMGVRHHWNDSPRCEQ